MPAQVVGFKLRSGSRQITTSQITPVQLVWPTQCVDTQALFQPHPPQPILYVCDRVSTTNTTPQHPDTTFSHTLPSRFTRRPRATRSSLARACGHAAAVRKARATAVSIPSGGAVSACLRRSHRIAGSRTPTRTFEASYSVSKRDTASAASSAGAGGSSSASSSRRRRWCSSCRRFPVPFRSRPVFVSGILSRANG